MNYVVLYPDCGEGNSKVNSLIRTAFNNVQQIQAVESIAVVVGSEEESATYNWLEKIVWTSTGVLILYPLSSFSVLF